MDGIETGDPRANSEGCYSGYCRCEALVDEPAWFRNGSSRCSRNAVTPRDDLAGARLCWQHVKVAEANGDVALIDHRRLIVTARRDSRGHWVFDGARILENVIDLERLLRDTPPPGWRPVTLDDQRHAAEVLGRYFERARQIAEAERTGH